MRVCFADSEIYGLNSNQTINTGAEMCYVLTNSNGPKIFLENGTHYVTNNNVGANDWGRVSVGKDVAWNESATGYMYEVICFNSSLADADISTLRTILKKYYTFI